MVNLFIFRRDLRLEDNTGLIKCLEEVKDDGVVCLFIFDPRQVIRNSFKSYNSIAFMIGSLRELDEALRKKGSKLEIFFGEAEREVEKILKGVKGNKVEGVYFNMDYTPFAVKRDTEIKKICAKYDVKCCLSEDILLQGIEEIMTGAGEPYKVFGQYHKAGLKKPVRRINRGGRWGKLDKKRSIKGNFNLEEAEKQFVGEKEMLGAMEDFKPGRMEGLNRMKEAVEEVVKPYPKKRDCLTFLTSQMSPYNKYGCISIRELYWAVYDRVRNKKHTYLQELYWRDFFTKIMYYFPETLGGAFYEKYEKLKWKPVEGGLNAWKKGITGFPIVDAGMRQINTIGWMHNRCRLIVASFLAKDLLTDWHEGEKYFSEKLVDIDLSVNTGNWATTVGVGASPLPYFRIMNPWLQQKKYDPNCEYIKTWIPELREVPTEDIHNWKEKCREWREKGVKYPKPIVDHDKQKKKAMAIYKAVA